MASGKAIGTGLGAAGGAAFGVPGLLIGSSLGGAIGGLFDTDDGAEAALQSALAQYEGLVPPDLARAIVYTQFQQGGQLSPQQLQSLPIEAQEAIKLVESPEMRQKQEVQRQALEQLSRTGMGPQELLALEKVRRTTAADAQSQLKSLMGKYAQMGQAGGGASLSAALEAGQGASDRAAMEAMGASAQAAENRRAAIKGAMDAASSMRATDLSVQERNVENERRKQEFDIQNAIARQQWNARAREEANRLNLARQQEVMDRNIAQQNRELQRQRDAEAQMYQNKFQLAQAKAGTYGLKGKLAQQQSQAEGENWAEISKGLAGLGGKALESGMSTESLYPSFKSEQSGGSNLGWSRYKNPNRFRLR